MDFDKLHKGGWIDKHRPLWWDLDYKPDPREFVGIDEFRQRLVNFGRHWYYLARKPFQMDFILYKAENVPITLIKTAIDGKEITYFATSRPYNQMELGHNAGRCWPVENMRTALEQSDMCAKDKNNKNFVCLDWHFFPHIRGIFKERRANHFFWYPLLDIECEPVIKNSLGELSDTFKVWGSYGVDWYAKVGSGSHHCYASPPHPTAYRELKSKRLISGKKHVKYVTSDLLEVAYDEFIEGLDGDSHMVSVYPVRHPKVDETVPLVLSTRTHKESRRRGPTVLGVMGSYSDRDYYRIWRIRDDGFCRDISRTLSNELGKSFDVVYFNQGRYRLVNAEV